MVENLRYNFPEIYKGDGRGKSPLLLRERADPAAPKTPVRGKSTSSSAPLLPWHKGGLSINISTSTIIITISISKIHFIPLIVYD
jgi:hypothetical protein